MLKINANVSKKVPIPGLEYSSQSFMAGMEVEVGDGTDIQEVQKKIREVYRLLQATIDAEIAEIREAKGSALVKPDQVIPLDGDEIKDF